MSESVVQLDGVCKHYGDGTTKRDVLKDVSLNVEVGDRLAVIGPSGSGKSTLLNVIAGLDSVDIGTVTRFGLENADHSDEKLARWRNAHVGFIFQDHHLLPQCTVIENILMPICAFASVEEKDKQRAQGLLEQVGMSDRAGSWPHQLSGGERQRVAVLRALILQPQLILADEPTGALDEENSEQIADMLDSLQQDTGAALLIVTHQRALADRMQRIFELAQHQLREL